MQSISIFSDWIKRDTHIKVAVLVIATLSALFAMISMPHMFGLLLYPLSIYMLGSRFWCNIEYTRRELTLYGIVFGIESLCSLYFANFN